MNYLKESGNQIFVDCYGMEVSFSFWCDPPCYDFWSHVPRFAINEGTFTFRSTCVVAITNACISGVRINEEASIIDVEVCHSFSVERSECVYNVNCCC